MAAGLQRHHCRRVGSRSVLPRGVSPPHRQRQHPLTPQPHCSLISSLRGASRDWGLDAMKDVFSSCTHRCKLGSWGWGPGCAVLSVNHLLTPGLLQQRGEPLNPLVLRLPFGPLLCSRGQLREGSKEVK